MKKKYYAIIAVFLVFSSIAQAQDDVRGKVHEKVHEVAQGVKHAAHVVGQGVRQGTHHVAVAAKHVKNRVIVHCGDGGHALSRPTACQGHGGVTQSL